MKIRKIAFGHSFDIDSKDFKNLCKKWTAKPYILADDITLASDNPLRFRNNLLQRI